MTTDETKRKASAIKLVALLDRYGEHLDRLDKWGSQREGFAETSALVDEMRGEVFRLAKVHELWAEFAVSHAEISYWVMIGRSVAAGEMLAVHMTRARALQNKCLAMLTEED